MVLTEPFNPKNSRIIQPSYHSKFVLTPINHKQELHLKLGMADVHQNQLPFMNQTFLITLYQLHYITPIIPTQTSIKWGVVFHESSDH